jgi:hypothetical protein
VKKKKIANVRRRRMRLWRRNEKANGSDFLKSDVGQRCSLNRLFKAQGSKKIKPSLIKSQAALPRTPIAPISTDTPGNALENIVFATFQLDFQNRKNTDSAPSIGSI